MMLRMRRLQVLGFALWLAAATLSPAFQGAASGLQPGMWEKMYAKVVTPKGTLNMRSAPQDDALVIGRLPKGAVVTILQIHDEWMKVLYKGDEGFVKSGFLEMITFAQFAPITKEDKGDTVMAFKRKLQKLDYLKSDDVNKRFDAAMETALTKVQLMNGIALNPEVVTPELQALMEWGMLVRGKLGYIGTATDKKSGLTVTLFTWDTGGTLWEDEQTVDVKISFAAQAAGGRPPYTVTVRKSVSQKGGEQHGDVVTGPFSFIWGPERDCIYIFATAVDSAGNTVTASTPFRYVMPERFKNH